MCSHLNLTFPSVRLVIVAHAIRRPSCRHVPSHFSPVSKWPCPFCAICRSPRWVARPQLPRMHTYLPRNTPSFSKPIYCAHADQLDTPVRSQHLLWDTLRRRSCVRYALVRIYPCCPVKGPVANSATSWYGLKNSPHVCGIRSFAGETLNG